jgi:molybdopterin converting factor small subunit
MQIAVELYGLPRARAGVAKTSANGDNLGDLLCDLARKFPQLGDACIAGRSLGPGYIVNLSGERFVTSPETPIRPNDTVLLLSLDAGG